MARVEPARSCVQVCSKACSLQKQIRWNRELLKMDAVIKYLETLDDPGDNT